MPSHLITWIVFAPLLGMLGVLAAPRERASWIRAIALVAALVPLALATWMCCTFAWGSAELQLVERANWLSSLRAEYHVGVDGLSLALVWLATLTAFVAVAASSEECAGKASYALVLLLELGVIGALVSLDLLLWFTFWQVSALALGLVAGRGAKLVLHAGVGSALILVAIVALRLDAGTFEVPTLVELARAGKLGGEHLAGGGALLGMPFNVWCFWFLLVGCAAQIPLAPLHAFFTGTLSELPTRLSLLQGGIARALGAFALLRVCIPLFPGPFRDHSFVLGCLGTATIVHGAFTSLRQRNWNGVFACLALGQMGWMLLGAAALTRVSVSGATLQLFTASAASAALFLAGKTLRGHELDELGGARRVLPRTFALATVSVFAGIGLPGFAIWVSQSRILSGACEASDARFRWLAGIATIAWLVGAASSLHTWRRAFFGPAKLEHTKLVDVTPREAFFGALLLTASIVPGIYPRLISAPILPSVLHLLELVRGAP